MFEPNSADLSQQAKMALKELVNDKHTKIVGTTNIIELHGHAASMELKGRSNSAYKDLWGLSYARADAVFNYLVSDDVGLKPDRFRLVANADREPLVPRAYEEDQQATNRYVSIIVTEELIEQFRQPQSQGGS